MDHESVKKAVAEAMQEQMKDFYIDRETHYQDHEFIKDLREWSKGFKTAFWGKIASAIAYALITCIVGWYFLTGQR